MGGSASIHSKEINMFGHDGLMGSNGPIGVGACFALRQPTIIFLGDAAAEEDYVLGGLGWASTKNLPLLTIIEDNNLSILTEKKVRRNWEMEDVAKSFKMNGYTINDDPLNIIELAGLISKASYVVANDTGPAHMTAHLGKSGVALFGHHTTAKKVSIETEKFKAITVDNLNDLTAEKVYLKIKDQLELIN